jgi:lipopolysaccharide transport system ATP-binding protein
MSSETTTAISVRGLGKKYAIAHNSTRPTSLREAITQRLRHPFGNGGQDRETFWALQDVDFDIRPGEVVGFIGRNGAGKSTLLKLLARVTGPTTGTIDIHGRMASLLEVGTGFNGELTGRENIFLNGSILGMSRREIVRKFDEIVAFAEIDRFLDTPVKRYSSGMHVRLAFAIAAHLEPEILILDEVLAVGDSNFQRKCLNKMEEVSDLGRTVLFVSHNMNTVTRICPRAILLQRGRVIADGPSDEVSREYLRSSQDTMACRSYPDPAEAPGNDVARLRSVRVRDEEGETIEVADIRRPVAVEMTFEVLRGGHVLIPNHHFYNEDGVCAFIVHDFGAPDWLRRPRPPGVYTSTMWIPGNFLSEGMMVVSPCVSTHAPEAVHFWERDAIAFMVVDSHDGDSARGDYVGNYPGVVRPMFRWETGYEAAEVPVAREAGGVIGAERRSP